MREIYIDGRNIRLMTPQELGRIVAAAKAFGCSMQNSDDGRGVIFRKDFPRGTKQSNERKNV